MTTKRKTHEQFVEELLKVNPNVDVLGRYVNAKTKIDVLCKVCGNVWSVTPDSLLNAKGCRKCPSKSRIPVHEYTKRLAEKKPTISMLSGYTCITSKAQFKCLVCEHEWYALASNVLNRTNCPNCSPNAKKSHATFVSQVEQTNKNIDVVGDYVNADTKVKFKCKIDGYEWDAVAASVLRGCGCPECNRRNRKAKCTKTHDQFINELELINKDVEILGQYTGSIKKLKARCLIDGYEWNAIPFNLLKGFGCPKCGDCVKKTHEEFVEELSRAKPNVEVLGAYLGTDARIKVRCKIDGYEWEPSSSAILHSSGCPMCAKSGFDPSKVSQFYVYAFGDYIGFGITNTPKSRHSKHSLTFKKHGFDAKLLLAIYGNGHEIKQLESHIKKILPVVDSGVDGFKTEAILYKNEKLLYDAIKLYCNISFGTEPLDNQNKTC